MVSELDGEALEGIPVLPTISWRWGTIKAIKREGIGQGFDHRFPSWVIVISCYTLQLGIDKCGNLFGKRFHFIDIIDVGERSCCVAMCHESHDWRS